MFLMEFSMYDETQQLDEVTTLLTDVTAQVEGDDERADMLLDLQTAVESHGKDGFTPLSISLLSIMFKQLDVPTVGLEHLSEQTGINASYLSGQIEIAIRGNEEDRIASMEGFFDVFKSFTTRTDEWVEKAISELTKLSGSLPRGGKGSYKTAGEYDSISSGIQVTARVVEYLATGYVKDIQRAGSELAEQMRKVFSARANIDVAIRNMKKIEVQPPGDFARSSGDLYTSPKLIGGRVLSITVDGKDSAADLSRVRSDGNTVETTTEDVLTAIRTTITMLKSLQKYTKTRVGMEKTMDDAATRKRWLLLVPGLMAVLASYMGIAYPYLVASASAMASPEIRRAFQLLFKDDNQKELLAELKAANSLIDLSVEVAKTTVAEVEKAAKSLKV